jgi:hypothetical protein
MRERAREASGYYARHGERAEWTRVFEELG